MACGDVLSLEDLQTAKKHQIFEAEVITGKVGGVAGGATIDTATNPVTGQTQQTLPSLLADLGFDVQSWTSSTGGVLASANQVFLNDTSGSLGLGDYYAWGGTFPKTVPAGTDPALPTSGYIMRSSRLAGVQAREALRRSYAEAGYTLVSGSFEAGGTLVNANDVLLHERTGKAFSGPAGTVAAGTNPAIGGFVDKSEGLLRHELATSTGIYNYRLFGIEHDVECLDLLNYAQDFIYQNGGGKIEFPDGFVVRVRDAIQLKGGVSISGDIEIYTEVTKGNPTNKWLMVNSDIAADYRLEDGSVGISAGQVTYPLLVGNSLDFSVGELVYMLIGKDPYDQNEEAERFFAQVVDNTPGNFTVSCGPAKSWDPSIRNKVLRFNRLNSGIDFNDLKFDRKSTTTITDTCLEIMHSTGVRVGNLISTNDGSVIVGVRECENVRIGHIFRPIGKTTFSASGRFYNGWGNKGVYIDGITGSVTANGVFLESGDDVEIGYYHVHALSGTGNTCSLTGASNLKIKELIYTAASGVLRNVISCIQKSVCKVEKLVIGSPIKYTYLANCDEFIYSPNNIDVCNPRTANLMFKLEPGMNGKVVTFDYGVVTELSVMCTDLTHVLNIRVGENVPGGLVNTKPSVSNMLTNFANFSSWGDDYPRQKNGIKQIVFDTGAGLTGDVYVTLSYRILSDRV